MATERDRSRRERRERHAAPEQEHTAQVPEHDQDSEPPRTARAPNTPEIDEQWGRQEGC